LPFGKRGRLLPDNALKYPKTFRKSDFRCWRLNVIYAYSAGATQANVLSDLVAIFTGTTDVNSLSASCNKSLTTITATTPAGWTLHDGSSGTNKKVIKAPYLDSGDKYVELDSYSTTNITLYMYETFNATTHTGTNKTGNSTYYPQRQDLTAGGKFYLFSSARYLAMVSDVTAGYGDPTRGGMTICSEFKPLCPWAAGYPAAALWLTGALFYYSKELYLIRAKGNDNSDKTGSSATAHFGTIGTNTNGSGFDNAINFPSAKTVYNNSGVQFTPFFPLFIVESSVFTMPVGDISDRSNIWIPPLNLLTHLSVTVKGGQDYIAVKAYSTAGRMLLFPK